MTAASRFSAAASAIEGPAARPLLIPGPQTI